MKNNILKITLSLLILLLATSNNYANQYELEDYDFSIKCNTFNPKKQTDQFQSEQQLMQCFAISPKGYFRIHYDTAGFHAVDLKGKDKNGIPDYIDSVCAVFDYVYEISVLQMGFIRPLTDR
jgi:hypothetical protein